MQQLKQKSRYNIQIYESILNIIELNLSKYSKINFLLSKCQKLILDTYKTNRRGKCYGDSLVLFQPECCQRQG